MTLVIAFVLRPITILSSILIGQVTQGISACDLSKHMCLIDGPEDMEGMACNQVYWDALYDIVHIYLLTRNSCGRL
ncbi:hypothetical protein F5X99DRAFT_385284, partial [Biscogniauxia marginata]